MSNWGSFILGLFASKSASPKLQDEFTNGSHFTTKFVPKLKKSGKSGFKATEIHEAFLIGYSEVTSIVPCSVSDVLGKGGLQIRHMPVYKSA